MTIVAMGLLPFLSMPSLPPLSTQHQVKMLQMLILVHCLEYSRTSNSAQSSNLLLKFCILRLSESIFLLYRKKTMCQSVSCDLQMLPTVAVLSLSLLNPPPPRLQSTWAWTAKSIHGSVTFSLVWTKRTHIPWPPTLLLSLSAPHTSSLFQIHEF